MSQNRLKLWVGLGACVMVGATGAAVAADAPAKAGVHAPAAAHGAMTQLAMGGEGGEAGHEAGGFEGMSADQALAGNLLLLRGHLSVGAELYAVGRADDAVIHYLHPSEEIYNEIAPALSARGVTGLAGELKALSDAVRAKKPQAEVAALQDKVLASVAQAQPTLGTAEQAAVLAAVLETAAGEYAVAYEGGSLANAAEYQDSRGFVWVAEAEAKAVHAFAAIAKGIAGLKKAWPDAVPAKDPAVSVAEVEAAVADLAQRCKQVK